MRQAHRVMEQVKARGSASRKRHISLSRAYEEASGGKAFSLLSPGVLRGQAARSGTNRQGHDRQQVYYSDAAAELELNTQN